MSISNYYKYDKLIKRNELLCKRGFGVLLLSLLLELASGAFFFCGGWRNMSDCKVKLRKADRNVFLFIRRYHKAGELYEQEALGDLYNVPFNCRIGYMQRVDPGCSSAIEAAQYLNEGDVLIVRTLWGLGNDFDEIVNTLDYFHGKKYSLLIYDAYYLDDLYKSKESGSFHYISRDYDVLRNAISLFYRKKGKYRCFSTQKPDSP